MIKKPCNCPNCPELITSGKYCDKHKKEFSKQNYLEKIKLRPKYLKAKRFYGSSVWQKVRMKQLIKDPYCKMCNALATEVDHILPINLGGNKTDPKNLQSLCKSCHSKKTYNDYNN